MFIYVSLDSRLVVLPIQLS